MAGTPRMEWIAGIVKRHRMFERIKDLAFTGLWGKNRQNRIAAGLKSASDLILIERTCPTRGHSYLSRLLATERVGRHCSGAIVQI